MRISEAFRAPALRRASAKAGAQRRTRPAPWLWAPAVAGALVGCSNVSHEQQQAIANERQAEAAAPRFPCATGPGALKPDCTAERVRTDKGWVLTLRHPDGHFRRVLVADDNRVTAADGAQPATVTPDGDHIAIAISGDRYRLPALR